MIEGVRTTPCRTCGSPIAFAVGNRGGFIPCEPASLREHVRDPGGNVVYERGLGHIKHACSGPRANPLPGPRSAPPRTFPKTDESLEEVHGALLLAQRQVDAARLLVERLIGVRARRGT